MCIFEMLLLIFVSSVCFCHGFLLDGKTLSPPTTGSVLTDAHYDFVMQFVIQERQSRLQLQKEVKQLQQQLLATQTDLTNKINTLDRCTSVERNRNDDLINKTSLLENKLNDLTKDFGAIKLQNNQLLLENKQLRNTSKRLETEVSNLNRLQSVSDMRVIVNLQNQTNHLEQEIKETNSRQSVISSGANARKQDFIALFQKLQTTESELHSNIDTISKDISYTTNILTRSINNSETSTNSRMQTLESSLQTSIAGVQQKLNATSNSRVLLSACASGGTYPTRKTIIFASIRTSHGINNLSSYRSSGKFTCESEGYYLISFFITTDTSAAYIYLYLNGNTIAIAIKHGTSDYQTHSALILYHLNVGDEIDLRAGSTFNVLGCNYSFFNIMQIL